MPKLTGPLFSVEAHKQLGKALTYQRRPSGASVYGYKKPKVPLTYLQVQQRGLIAAATAYWQSLSDAAKAEWETKAQGQGQSGYSYMIKQYCELNFDRPLWLPFNEGVGTDTLDRSGHGNNGVIYGASWQSGLFGYALYFDGLNDYVRVEDALSLNITDTITIEVWVKTSVVEKTSHVGIMDKGGRYTINRSPSASGFALYGRLSLGGTLRYTDNFVGELDRWYLIHVTYDKDAGANNLKIFSNGGLIGQRTYTGSIDTSAEPLYIGRRGTLYFKGSEDSFRVYNRVLSSDEILRSFRRQWGLYGV